MLAKDPGQRYQSCAELIQDLRNYQSLGTAVSKNQTSAGPAAVIAPGSRRPLLAALLAVLLVVIMVLGYFLYQQYQRTASPSATLGGTSPPASGRGQNAQQSALEASALKAGTKAPAQGVSTPDKQAGVTQKQLPAAEKPGHAEVHLAFAGDSYPVTVYDGNRRLEDLPSGAPSLQVTTGDHRFRVVSNEVYLDQQSGTIRLKADQVYPITIPGLGSAYIEVPNDAYDGCEILVSGMKLATPYPAQVPKLAAGDHRISFRWSAGKYAGKEFSNIFAIEANHHYRVRGDPQTNQVVVQQIK